MLRSSFVASASAFALVAFGLAREPGGCGGDGDGDGRVNAPCTRDRDCRRELSCVEGVCTAPDAGSVSSTSSTSSSSGSTSGGVDAATEAGP